VVDTVQFQLLGPVQAVWNGDALPLGGPRQRALLALLLLEPGRPISTDRLIDELWHGHPPPGAATTLRSYASRLRSVLGEAASLTATPGGYALTVAADRIDAQRFERLVREGEEALSAGRTRRARQRAVAALELWRGRPFADLADDGALRVEAERLAQLQLLALEARIEADLTLGRSAELVEELLALVSTYPYRERLWRQLMLALYRAERQADALEAYRRARERLAADLGLEPSEDLRRLEAAILHHEVPEVQAAKDRYNLPAPISSFIGRHAELADLGRLLDEARLVTLTGVGGVGKTRLALEAAAGAALQFEDGAAFVDFAPLADPGLVPRHVASALGLTEQPGRPSDRQLADHLRDAELLLLLDNCEHLHEACGDLALNLLSGCPALRILATSRRSLGLEGEIDYPVPPLALPPLGADPAELHASEAVRLFLTRAREARPKLDVTASLEDAGEICRELDGIALAIELAAARAKALSLDEIAAKLADRFRFLVSWRRLTPARHRTLRETMDWSYELLSEDEQAFLARLSAFAGDFTPQAAAHVCLDADDERALELVSRLINASLVIAEDRGDETRYRLLETVREYAAERLVERGETDSIRSRHVAWALAFAEDAEPKLTGGEQTHWFAILEREADNLRAALAYGSTGDDAELSLRLAIALSRFWYVRGHLAEGRRWLERALDNTEGQVPALRRRALTATASIALLQGDYGVATVLAEQALAAARDSDDPAAVANALSNLGAIVLATGDTKRAGGLLAEAVTLARDAGDQRVAALAINNFGDLALTAGDYERAEPLFEESLDLLRARGDTANIARSLFNLGAVALELGRFDDARARFRESLTFARQAEDKEDIVWCLEGFAAVAAAAGRGGDAAVLLGAASALLAEIGAEFKPFERQLHARTERQAAALCGDASFAAAVERGRSLSLSAALALITAG